MPNQDGKLTPTEIEMVRQKLASLWATYGSVACPVCRKDNWQIGPAVVAPPKITTGGVLVLYGVQFPYVPIMCLVCGHTIFFNGVHLGLFPPSQAPPPT